MPETVNTTSESTDQVPATRAAAQVLVTGAAGYVGSRLMERLVADQAFASARFTAVDSRPPSPEAAWAADSRVRTLTGDITDPELVDRIVSPTPDLVFHLAGILGGAAEADYHLARAVNVDGTLTLLERLSEHSGTPPRVVYASSIAVFGPPLPGVVDDASVPHPLMNYGAQKLMIETVIDQFSARGRIDGIAVRLPGIVARADADSRQRSAFLNTVFHAARRGERFTMPVSPDGHSWLVSVRTVVDDLIHAGRLAPARLSRSRAITMPALVVRIGDLVDTLAEVFPRSRGTIDFAPDEELQSQFADQPRLRTATADDLGFAHDGSLEDLIRRALE